MTQKNCFEINDPLVFRKKMLNWANQFSIFCYLDGNGYPANRAFPSVLAAGAKRSVVLSSGSAFNTLQHFHDQQPSLIFGHLGFSLMEETEGVAAKQTASPDFGDGFFFEPLILLRTEGNMVSIESEEPADEIFRAILAYPVPETSANDIAVRSLISRDEYLKAVQSVQDHIRLGDCYELNYCQAFQSEKATIHPVDTYLRLMEITPNPFSSLYRKGDLYCISSSPERFIKKEGSSVTSQPMKGTAPRYGDTGDDLKSRMVLKESAKEQSENVMIVDLVRNDLSKCCEAGSVEVDELFGIYSFPTVHQMISTVSGRLSEDRHWSELLSSCFPMGSMTGAPKKRVLELTALYEKIGRGLYSGSIGYIDSAGNFDFNVVIRSIFYDQSSGLIRFLTGGAITFYSDPEKEYEESLLKASAMMRALGAEQIDSP